MKASLRKSNRGDRPVCTWIAIIMAKATTQGAVAFDV